MSEHVLEHLSAYLDGELGAAESERFRAHLSECAACSKRLEQLSSLDASLRELPAAAPEGYFEGLPSRVRARLSRAAAPRRLSRPPAWALAAAAALIVGVLAPLTSREQKAPPATAVEAVAPAASPAADADQYKRAAAAPAAGAADKLAPITEAKKRAEAQPAATTARDAPQERIAGRLEAQAGIRGKAKLEKEQALPEPVATVAQRPEVPAPAAPPPAAAPPAGYAEPPPRQYQQPTQEFGPRASQQAQQAEPRRQTPPSKNAEPQAEEAERADKRSADLKDAPVAAERDVAKADEGRRREPAGFAAPARSLSASGGYRDLLARTPRDAADARSLRDSWRRLSSTLRDPAQVDEARVRVIEMSVAAWRFDRLAEDRTQADRDGAAYLARSDTRQAARVRELLATLDR